MFLLLVRGYCCDRKSRAAYVQSFALCQQATIEFTCHDHSSRTLLLRSMVHKLISAQLPRHDHSIFAYSRHIYVWCCSSRTFRSGWITQSTQHHWRGCNNTNWDFGRGEAACMMPNSIEKICSFVKQWKCARNIFMVFVTLSDLNKTSNRAVTHTYKMYKNISVLL